MKEEKYTKTMETMGQYLAIVSLALVCGVATIIVAGILGLVGRWVWSWF